MASYSGIQKEETLKSLVHEDYFSKFGYEPNIDNIDFAITDKTVDSEQWLVASKELPNENLFTNHLPLATNHYLWAEVKKGTQDVFDMLTQLILTCKKTYEKGEHLAPPWLGCFDETRIAFVAFYDMLPIFNETDFNWNTVPSNHDAVDFKKARNKVEKLIGAKIVIYNFGSDDREIKEFIKTHFAAGASASIKSPITKDNFVQIFIKWVKEVKPFIDVTKEEWLDYKKAGILDGDFFRADMMSSGGNTISEKLKIVLKNDNYRLQDKNTFGKLSFSDIGFTDGGAAYSRFWNRYERPPAQEYQQHIIDRRDLLVPANIREVKGSFFTPKIWADKSKEYLAKVFGDNWQDEYYIWDCAAGTGNLLAGLTNKYNIWASDIDAGNVETMQSLIDIDENLNLLSGHIFQFDFLNDSFDKLPAELKKIIYDSEKRKKLIVYINPPYAEHSNRATIVAKGANRSNLARESNVYHSFSKSLGTATRELFIQFFLRIYKDLSNSILASFSTLKYINSQNMMKFREYFKAEFKTGFICQANTFDNVKGKFPICFSILYLQNKKDISLFEFDVLSHDDNLKNCKNNGKKTLFPPEKGAFIINWLRKYYDSESDRIDYLRLQGTDFANNKGIFFTSCPSANDFEEHLLTNITQKNIIEMCIYLAVRHCIEPTWLNNRDQFLFPNDGYKTDINFQNNCLVFALFHGQNKISSQHDVNHWIPFTENEVGSREKFESAFMSDFLKKRNLTTNDTNHTNKNESINEKVRDVSEVRGSFSSEAAAVLDAGRELWKYYHGKIKDNKTASHNASFYDIREYFQGRKASGNMNTSSTDETYNALIAELRGHLKNAYTKNTV